MPGTKDKGGDSLSRALSAPVLGMGEEEEERARLLVTSINNKVGDLVKFYGDLQKREEEKAEAETFALRSAEGASTSTSGEKFLRDYYECLSKDLDRLVDFYHEDAVMTLQYGEDAFAGGAFDMKNPLSPIGREINRKPVVEGKAEIEERLKYIYKGRSVAISSIDCQMSSRGTMLLVAAGTLYNNSSGGTEGEGEESPSYGYLGVAFVQSFIVSCHDSDLKIMNDILRKSEPLAAPPPVPQLATRIGTPVIGAGGATSASAQRREETTPATTIPYKSAVPREGQPSTVSSSKSKSGATTSSSSRRSGERSRRRRRRDRRPTPKRLFQPVSLSESLVSSSSGEGKHGRGERAQNLAALMTFIASLCEILVNSVWSAVAILHVVGTLSLLLSVSAMFLKSRNDLFVLEQKAKEIENAFQTTGSASASSGAHYAAGERVENLDLKAFLKVDKMEAGAFEMGSHSSASHSGSNLLNTGSAPSSSSSKVKVRAEDVFGNVKGGPGNTLLTSLQNGDFPVKEGGGLPLFKEET